MAKKNFIIIALGSNLGKKHRNLISGLSFLRKMIDVENCSYIYESKALLPKGAPRSWDNDFYNCVLCGRTNLSVEKLLGFCNKVESHVAGGERDKGSWAPRYLDVDIIAFNNEVIKTKKLTIPHSRMLERDFVLLPLTDILPEWEHPEVKQKANTLAKKIKRSAGIKKLRLKML